VALGETADKVIPMTDVKDRPASLEDIGAGLLSGAMTLLGYAFAGLIAWQIVAQWSGWLPDLKAMSAGLPPVDFKAMTSDDRRALIQDSVIGAALLLATFGLIRGGVRHIRKNLALLRIRRDERTTPGSRL
jgi:hypothetical protein